MLFRSYHQYYKQDVGFYLHREGPNLGKTSCPLPPVTIRLDAQFGTPYPRSAGFDTDNDQSLFGVPDEIGDMTRTLEMVEP